jgi:hypothetical protein
MMVPTCNGRCFRAWFILVGAVVFFSFTPSPTTALDFDKSSSGSDPNYADYGVETVFRGRPAKPIFKPGTDKWPDADPRFRDSTEYQVRKGANFAGAYIVVKTTCGTGCFYVVIVDARTGRIFEDLPFRTIVVGRPNQFRGLSFRLDSRLLIVEGLVDGAHRPTRTSYEWTEGGLRLIQRVRITQQ